MNHGLTRTERLIQYYLLCASVEPRVLQQIARHYHRNVVSESKKVHNQLLDLNRDDHTQYALLAGRVGDTLQIDDIIEETLNHGIEIEGVLSKDGDVTFDKASGNGIKVDTGTPTFGWRDLLGAIRTRGVGATDPGDAVYIGNIKAYQFAVNDEFWVDYHIPHDYVEGTDIHLHFHWSHIGNLVTGGNVTWGADITYAKGHNQAAFPATVNTTVVGAASTTQYQHMITEIQISASAPGASEIDTDDLEPDGVIMIRGYLSANNITVSGGAVPDPFLHFTDVHYQTTNIGTKAKVPNFYT